MENYEKYRRTFTNFERAFNKFKEAVEQSELFNTLSEEIKIEVVTKRFEYLYESCWKALKEYLEVQGVLCSTPLQCFKEAFKAGLIEEKYEQTFFELVEKRNLIVHIYSFERAKEIFNFITKEEIISAFISLINKMKQTL